MAEVTIEEKYTELLVKYNTTLREYNATIVKISEIAHEAAVYREHMIGDGWVPFEAWRTAFVADRVADRGEIEDWPQTDSGAYLIVLEALQTLNDACDCADDDPSPLLYVRGSGGAVCCFNKGEITGKEFTLDDMHDENIDGQGESSDES